MIPSYEQPKNLSQSFSNNQSSHKEVIVRINGVLPDMRRLGNQQTSERYAEILQSRMETNTSCSIIIRDTKQNIPDSEFHILFDLGKGVTSSVEKGLSDLGIEKYRSERNHGQSSLRSSPAIGSPLLLSSLNSDATQNSALQEKEANLFDALLISHPHEDHIGDLPNLILRQSAIADHAMKSKIRIYCTRASEDYIMKDLLSRTSLAKNSIEKCIDFQIVTPNESFNVGPFSIVAFQAYHGNESPDGAVIYVVNILNIKIIIGWDFLSLPEANESILWNPDLLILGAETYNPHPETGMISVTEAYDLVRRWNAKECYIVHYSGFEDFEEGSNQWFRGPVKPMSSAELQSTIDSHLRISGAQGKFRILVAKEGMIWTRKEDGNSHPTNSDKVGSQIGSNIEIESLERYVLKVENDDKIGKLRLVIEDRINRYDLVFENPRLEKSKDNNYTLYALGEKGLLAKGPDLVAELIRDSSVLRIYVSKGRKTIFHDDILLGKNEIIKFEQYLLANFE
jgi:L-ascorbate metabolism protein UlaG (beta-lactamase superfamily)